MCKISDSRLSCDITNKYMYETPGLSAKVQAQRVYTVYCNAHAYTHKMNLSISCVGFTLQVQRLSTRIRCVPYSDVCGNDSCHEYCAMCVFTLGRVYTNEFNIQCIGEQISITVRSL